MSKIEGIIIQGENGLEQLEPQPVLYNGDTLHKEYRNIYEHAEVGSTLGRWWIESKDV